MRMRHIQRYSRDYYLLQSNEAVMGRDRPMVSSTTESFFKSNFAASQYRHNIDEYLYDPVTIFAYPVFDSFQGLSG
jgi:hypothetical protein